MDIIVWKYRFEKERYVKQKKVEFCRSTVKGHVWKESGVTTQERRKVELAILLLNNDKNNITAKIALSYLQCLSPKFEA